MIGDFILSFKKIDLKIKFKYMFILIISLIIFNKIDIKTNQIFGLLIGILIIIYLRLDDINNNSDDSVRQEIKKNTIKPEINRIKKYEDILNFLFSIQDLYIYNPEAYEELVINLELFLEIYENTKIDNKFYTQYYKIAYKVKRECLNGLNSIVYNAADKIEVRNKIEDSIVVLEGILNKYTKELYEICHEKIDEYGYNMKTIPVNNHFKPANEYINEKYLYSIY
jgi:hypothetical protein